jgi:hypothetical protein
MCYVSFALLAAFAPLWAGADQVEMQNGDRYVGSVVSLSGETLVLKNEMLGTVQLPRNKVAHISLIPVPAKAAATLAAPPAPKARVTATMASAPDSETAPALRQLGAHTNLIRQVQKKFLADAGPEANQKFDELLNGLISGKLNMNDLRAQAQSAVNQLRELKRQGGEDAGFATDTYLTILDHFLKEMPSSESITNALVPSPTAKHDSEPPQD